MCKGLEPLDILPGLPKLQAPDLKLEIRDKSQAAEDKSKKQVSYDNKSLISDDYALESISKDSVAVTEQNCTEAMKQ
jgi:hypothetical protein